MQHFIGFLKSYSKNELSSKYKKKIFCILFLGIAYYILKKLSQQSHFCEVVKFIPKKVDSVPFMYLRFRRPGVKLPMPKEFADYSKH